MGYWEYRNEQIAKNISDPQLLEQFRKEKLPEYFGYKLDERIVEYPWIFSRIPREKIKLLDAGSTFNYDFILENIDLSRIKLCVLTYAPEPLNYNEKGISYIYADLRDIPFRDEYFDVIVSQSTIEHIDMDNSIYGHTVKLDGNNNTKSYEYIKAIAEMLRVLKKGGIMLLTFPYGKFENHGFFQQFDEEMLNRVLDILAREGSYTTTFFRYLPQGWVTCKQEECENVEAYNPHTGKGKGTDGAAHCRSICCIQFHKSQE
ncbi:MAG: class I SAM-dependent methyltransferase [Nitrososphaeria archaeon]